MNKNKNFPIIDYINENPSQYKTNYKIIKNNILTHKNNIFAIKMSSLNINNNKEHSFILLDKLCHYAYKNNSKIMIDAEDYLIQDNIDYISNIMMKQYNKEKVVVYKTYQMYRKDSYNKLNNELLCDRNYYLGIKLVRGAYYNQDKKYNILFENLNETHDNYNKAILNLLKHSKNKDNIMIASHNNYSISYIIKKNEIFKRNNICFAQLMGMDNKNKQYVKENNYNMFLYLPYGNFKESIPYLIRRLYENFPLISKIIH